VTSNALDAAAIAILFSTFFAAHTSGISCRQPPRSCACAVTVVAVLPIRHESLFIAVLGLLGARDAGAAVDGREPSDSSVRVLADAERGLAWVRLAKEVADFTVLIILTAIIVGLGDEVPASQLSSRWVMPNSPSSR
jgi:hypothetical protein